MCSDVALRVSRLSKCYPPPEHPRKRLLQLLFGRRDTQERRCCALNDVSFTLKRGEVLGVIGPNGAGKSTLLQLIAGTLKPTTGEVKVGGRVTALLELGAGMDTELSGLENIFLMGGTYGLDRQAVEERLAEIIRFSELGESINNPVKTYSSGMFVRLAFSVSTALEPDIFIVDEALSVGDVGFQAKCLDRLEGLIAGGSSILLASHDVQLIKNYCTQAICLEKGKIAAEGEPEFVVERYFFLMRSRTQNGQGGLTWTATNATGDVRFASDRGAIDSVEIESDASVSTFRSGDQIRVIVRGTLDRARCANPTVEVMLRDSRGYNLYGLTARADRNEVRVSEEGRFESRFRIPLNVTTGHYSLTVRLEDKRTDRIMTLLDKRVGICGFSVGAPDRTFLGTVNLFGNALKLDEYADQGEPR